jgi:hypothetical protein
MADTGGGEIRFCETIDLIQIQGEGLFIWETIWNDAMSTGRTLGRQMFGSDVRFRCSVQMFGSGQRGGPHATSDCLLFGDVVVIHIKAAYQSH